MSKDLLAWLLAVVAFAVVAVDYFSDDGEGPA